jgi:hypothetical protein
MPDSPGAGRHAALEAALAGAFPPPATPAELHAGVLAAIARERFDWQARRRDLEDEHRAAIAQLNRRFLHRSRDALLICASLFAALGLGFQPLCHGLTSYFDDAAPMVAGLISLSLGMLCGAAILRHLFRDSEAPI